MHAAVEARQTASMSGRVRRWAVGLAMVAVVATGCGDDSGETTAAADGAGPDTSSETSTAGGSEDSAAGEVDPTEACDRLEDLATAILGARGATTAAEVEKRVEDPFDAFRQAAMDSGDPDLAGFAETASDRFEVYLSGQGIDAREAGNDFDIALDRSMERCVVLGATNDFPQEPSS